MARRTRPSTHHGVLKSLNFCHADLPACAGSSELALSRLADAGAPLSRSGGVMLKPYPGARDPLPLSVAFRLAGSAPPYKDEVPWARQPHLPGKRALRR